MSTLVTGALGQIGSRCRRLLDRSALALDARAGEGVTACDLRQPVTEDVRAALAGVTRVIHLAGSRTDLPFDAAVAWQATEANAIGTAHLLAALPARLDHVVLVSSISVYRAAPRGAKLVESDPVQPRSAYGASKANAERIVRMWADRTGTPVTIARVAQVYGEGTDPRNGLYRMFAAAMAGQPITVACRPDLRRDYIHVDDVARILCGIAARPGDRIVNLGSGDGIAMLELARLVAAACGAPPPRVEAGSDGGEDLVLETSALGALGLAPAIAIHDGVRSEHARIAAS
jgi:nucleoside-diphosphate-sugar epimerase